ncbi:MAG: hypothetical protein GX952_06505 [Firmicutes bacterium]|nr:hypothetical protein [Bacillota bacterium]
MGCFFLSGPRIAQAVGNAIGRNPVSYFLPTHRIFPQHGLGICKTSAGHSGKKLLALVISQAHLPEPATSYVPVEATSPWKVRG